MSLSSSGQGLELIGRSVHAYSSWLKVGAIAPDYSCLYQISSREQIDEWSDLLHQDKCGDAVRAGVEWLSRRTIDQDSPEFGKALAWLAGYLSHIVLDATIHPVVHSIVGEYDRNLVDHRRCEMFMDAYLCTRRRGYVTEIANWKRVMQQVSEDGTFDGAIRSIWSYILATTYPETYVLNPPALAEWHRKYVQAIDDACPEGVFFRHAAPGTAYHYLASGKLPKDAHLIYIDHCSLPEGNRFGRNEMHFDEVFRFGLSNVILFWEKLEVAVACSDAGLFDLPNWDLDQGTVNTKGEPNLSLWA